MLQAHYLCTLKSHPPNSCKIDIFISTWHLHLKWFWADRRKKWLCIEYPKTPEAGSLYVCTWEGRDTHCLWASSSAGPGVAAHVRGVSWGAHVCTWLDRWATKLKRIAGLELEGPDDFWLAWKLNCNHYEGLQICPITIFVKPSTRWEELKQSIREAAGSAMC